MIGAGASMRVPEPRSWLAAVRRFAASAPFAYISDHKARSLRAREEPNANELRVPIRLLSVLCRAWVKRMSGRRLLGLSSMATRYILADLARDYEASHGTRVEIRSMGGVEAAKLVRSGQATDVVVLASQVMGEPGRPKAIQEQVATRDFARSADWPCVLARARLRRASR